MALLRSNRNCQNGNCWPEIITAIYERHVVGRRPDFAYPVVGERALALQVVDGESEVHASEVDD